MDAFNVVHNRKDTRSLKWDTLESVFQTNDVLPMWVADMDFKAPQEVNDALIERVKHGFWGYTVIDNDVKEPIVRWLKNRHDWTIDPAWLSFSPGVVTSLHMAIEAFTEPGDKVLIQTPVYGPFYDVIEKQQRTIVKNSLILENQYYHIDFNDFEEKLQEGVKAFILCSPHNPVGRVWKKEELLKMAELCIKHDVLIISDEIHCDLVFTGHHHIPIATLSHDVSQETVTCMSASKTFNMAGLQSSYVITENPAKRRQLDKYLDKYGLNVLNTLGNVGLEAAYTHGEAWLDQLIEVLEKNRDYVIHMLEKHTTELQVIHPEGTYLMWIDCSGLNMDSDTLNKFMIEQAKVGLNRGLAYGEEGDQFMRINIACPPSTLEEGIRRIITAINNR